MRLRCDKEGVELIGTPDSPVQRHDYEGVSCGRLDWLQAAGQHGLHLRVPSARCGVRAKRSMPTMAVLRGLRGRRGRPGRGRALRSRPGAGLVVASVQCEARCSGRCRGGIQRGSWASPLRRMPQPTRPVISDGRDGSIDVLATLGAHAGLVSGRLRGFLCLEAANPGSPRGGCLPNRRVRR
jgi:hypothetical protein